MVYRRRYRRRSYGTGVRRYKRRTYKRRRYTTGRRRYSGARRRPAYMTRGRQGALYGNYLQWDVINSVGRIKNLNMGGSAIGILGVQRRAETKTLAEEERALRKQAAATRMEAMMLSRTDAIAPKTSSTAS